MSRTNGPEPGDPGRVLVLGADGFLGRHTVAAVRAAGHHVVEAVRRPGTRPAGDPAVVLDPLATPAPDLRALLTELRPTGVVNAAGAVWSTTADAMHAANVVLVERLLDAVAGLVSRPRVVQLGTVHEYGVDGRADGVPESRRPEPVNDYGRSKLAATRAVLAATRERGVDAVVLRIGNVTGPGSPRGSLLGGVACRLAEEADAARGTVDLGLGPLRAQRDFVDVRDVADAVVAALTAPVTGEIVNVGRGRAETVDELVDRLVEISGVPTRRPPAPEPGEAGVDRLHLDVTKATALLGWTPRRDLTTSLRDTLESARSGGR